MEKIRNFSIIAHINHGKSTLADRLLETTGTVSQSEMRDQFLDTNPIERERGITIKLAPVRMNYSLGAKTYVLNLIDTPGHVDFSYEVSRSLAACEGAILVVDAVSGIQAQSLANFSLARRQGLVIIPVINKIDLEIAQPEKVAREISERLGFNKEEIIFTSAKTGQNADRVLEAVVKRIPPPQGDPNQAFRGLIFNSFYDPHKGVIIWVRVVDGKLTAELIRAKKKIKFLGSGAVGNLLEMGLFAPMMTPRPSLTAGEVGYLATGLKDLSFSHVGDTVTLVDDSGVVPLPGYQEAKPMVFAGLYPVDNNDLPLLEDGLGKLKLSDAALSFKTEISQGLGKGFRCGFLGLLHAEIVQERLEREFKVNLIITPPTVEYQVVKKDGQRIRILRAPDLPDPAQIKAIYEPVIMVSIFTPVEFLNPIISLCKERRAKLIDQEYFGDQVKLDFKMPLAEMVIDFYDKIKNLSSGFASLDWEEAGFAEIEAVRLDILINSQRVDAFSRIISRKILQAEGKRLAERLKRLIPRQLFEVVIQAAAGGKILARETIPPFRKDVTAKLYGGDRTRRMKLLEKQKKGKKRMKAVGRLSLPQGVFLEVFKK
jgi:GTP-binding protein LepA